MIVLCLLMIAVSFFVKYLTPAKLDGGSNRIGMPYMPDMGGSKNEGVVPHRSSERLPANRKPFPRKNLKVVVPSKPKKSPRKNLKVVVPSKPKKSLPQEVINGIKKFVFMVGNIRSGSSILGSLIDAHPHMLIANEWTFPQFDKVKPETDFKSWLFNALYSQCSDLRGRKLNQKGYDLYVEGLWQGRYDGHIEVIGDKSAGQISYLFNTTEFKKSFDILQRNLEMPIYALQPMRNPFDMIATSSILAKGVNGLPEGRKTYVQLKNSQRPKYNIPPAVVDAQIDIVFSYFTAALDVTKKVIERITYFWFITVT